MKLKLLLVPLLCVAASIPAGAAKNTWTLKGVTYGVDTLIYEHQVGPGVTFAKYRLPDMPLLVSVLTMDLKNKYVDYETCKSGDRGIAEETPTSMYARKNKPGHDVIGATNGDFYFYSGANPAESGTPRSGQFCNDTCIAAPDGWAAFVLSKDRKPYIDRVDFSGKMTANGATYRLYSVNKHLLEDEDVGGNQLTLYTKSYGPTIKNCTGGKKAIISPKSGYFFWRSNTDITAVVDSVIDGGDGMAIPAGAAVLWGEGTFATTLASLTPGTELTLNLGTNLRNQPGLVKDFKELMGGSNTIIMRNGVVEDPWDERHPRTVIGFSADSTKVYFVVIDGRCVESLGTTNAESAGVLLALGAANANNCDGGGSSCMVVNGDVVNRPSDGPVRAVGNGNLLVSTAPVDDTIGMLGFEPRSFNIPKTAKIKPAIWGYNQYGVLKNKNLEGVTFTCDPQIGKIAADGSFVAGSTVAAGNLTAHYGSLTVSTKVIVVDTQKSLRLDSLLIDNTHPYKIEVFGTSGINMDPLDASIVNWTSDDANVCTVDASGVISATANGVTRVNGKAAGLDASMRVTVQNPAAHVMAADPNLDLSTWNITQSGGTGRTVTAFENGMKITYKGASSRSNYIKFLKNLKFWGLPDTLRLRINPGDAPVKSVVFDTYGTDGKKVLSTFPFTGAANQVTTIDLPMNAWCNTSDLALYPLSLLYINLSMGTSTTGKEYTIEIPGIELVYSSVKSSGVANIANDGVALLFPNPLPHGENATLLLPVATSRARVSIYAANGQLVGAHALAAASGKISVPTAGLMPGMYLVNVTTEKVDKTIKLLVK